jgi:hypothetical protein
MTLLGFHKGPDDPELTNNGPCLSNLFQAMTNTPVGPIHMTGYQEKNGNS